MLESVCIQLDVFKSHSTRLCSNQYHHAVDAVCVLVRQAQLTLFMQTAMGDEMNKEYPNSQFANVSIVAKKIEFS